MSSPTQRSLKLLRELGFDAEVVEKWNPHARQRKDLYGFIDILGVHDSGEILAVQATSYSNISSRIKKINESERLPRLRKANIRVEVWGWIKRKGRWTVSRRDIS